MKKSAFPRASICSVKRSEKSQSVSDRSDFLDLFSIHSKQSVHNKFAPKTIKYVAQIYHSFRRIGTIAVLNFAGSADQYRISGLHP